MHLDLGITLWPMTLGVVNYDVVLSLAWAERNGIKKSEVKKWSYNSSFKIASAVVLLALYISMVFVSDVTTLMCNCCHHHHDADVHTSFRHIHHCEESGCHQQNICECDAPILKRAHCCNHDHSTEVKLYIQPRTDDGQLREALLLAILMDNSVEIPSPEHILSFAYQEHILPAIAAGYGGGCSLRAPPQMV